MFDSKAQANLNGAPYIAPLCVGSRPYLIEKGTNALAYWIGASVTTGKKFYGRHQISFKNKLKITYGFLKLIDKGNLVQLFTGFSIS
jgi:hypothetical protein